MKIGWLISGTGVFGSVREMIETSNVMVKEGHAVTIYSPDLTYSGWLPCSATFKNMDRLKRDDLDCLILMTTPQDNFFNLWKQAKAKIKTFCMMGFPTESLHTEDDEFLSKKHDWIIKNHWCICDGSWQLEYMKRYNEDMGPAIGGINLEMFHTEKVKKVWDVVYSGDPRPRKGTDMVREAIRGLRSGYYFGKGVPQMELSKFLNQGRIFVDGHSQGGWCNPVIEAMASGVNVVCTDIKCTRDFAINWETALTVAPRDSDGMRRRVDLLLQKPDLAEELRVNALKKVKEFDYKIVAPRLIETIANRCKG